METCREWVTVSLRSGRPRDTRLWATCATALTARWKQSPKVGRNDVEEFKKDLVTGPQWSRVEQVEEITSGTDRSLYRFIQNRTINYG